jgi:hypothetical protein
VRHPAWKVKYAKRCARIRRSLTDKAIARRLYVSGDWRIRHTSKGFGISDCSLYRDGEFVAQVVNENALSRLQELAAGVEACEKDARDAVCLT